MVQNEANIYIADKRIQFGRDVCLGILNIGKQLARPENPPLMHYGEIKMLRDISNSFNFLLSGPIYTKFGVLP